MPELPEVETVRRELEPWLTGRTIVRAARTLMQETGQAGFSMRGLADKAGLSIATPYNWVQPIWSGNLAQPSLTMAQLMPMTPS